MEIILILLLLIPFIFIGLIVYVMKVYDNTNDESDKDTVNIGDVFVYEPISVKTDPFKDDFTVSEKKKFLLLSENLILANATFTGRLSGEIK